MAFVAEGAVLVNNNPWTRRPLKRDTRIFLFLPEEGLSCALSISILVCR